MEQIIQGSNSLKPSILNQLFVAHVPQSQKNMLKSRKESQL